MLYVKNMVSAPIVGVYDESILELSAKIAESYNRSINKVNNNLFLGFEFQNIPELKNITANLNLKKRVLEINISRNTQIIIPSKYATIKELNEYFDFSNEKKILDEIILEKKMLSKNSLLEDFKLKGKADSIFSDISSGIDSAKKIFQQQIEIKNAESINHLAKNISNDLKRILKIKPETSAIVNVISNFIINGKANDLNQLYDGLFNSTLQSVYVDDCISNIHNVIVAKMKDGEFSGRTKDSDMLTIVANSYRADAVEIEKRLKSPTVIKKVSRIKNIIENAVSTTVSALQSITFSAAGFYTLWAGIIGLLGKVVEYILSLAIEIIQYLLGGNDDISAAKGIIGKLVATKNWVVENGGDVVQKVSGVAVDEMTKLTSKLEALPFFRVGKCLVGALLLYIAFKYILRTINSYFGLTDEFSTENERLAARISEEQLSNNFGFDKILATEGVIAIMVGHIQNAIDTKSFSTEEENRLKDIIRALYKTHKKKTKEGIKFFFKGIKERD